MAFKKTANTKSAPKHETKAPASKDKIHLVVPSDIGPCKKGDTVTTAKLLGEVARVALAARISTADRVVDPMAIEIDDKQIVATLATIERDDDTDDDDYFNALLDALEAIQSSGKAPLKDMRELERLSSELQMAHQAGLKASTVMATIDTRAIEGQKDWTGAPVLLEKEIVKVYGPKELAKMPIVGTNKQNKKNSKTNKTRNNVPDDYNMPTDYFAVEQQGGTYEYFRYCTEWVRAMPHVQPVVNRIKLVSDILRGSAEGKLVPAELNKLSKQDLEGLRVDLNNEVSGRVRCYANALAYWQIKTAIHDLLGENVAIELVDNAEKKKKPIRIMAKMENGKWGEIASKSPMSLGSFIKLKPAEARANGGPDAKASHLMATLKRPPTAPGDKNKAVSATAIVPARIENTSNCESILHHVWDFLEYNKDTVSKRLAEPDGDSFAYWIVNTNSALRRLASDDAVKARAVAYDKRQIAAAEAARAATETNGNNKPAEKKEAA